MPDALMIAIGKKKGPPTRESAAAPPMAKSGPPEPPSRPAPAEHKEPDADQMGGASDNDADNNIAQYAQEIASDPELAHPFANFLAAVCEKLRGAGGGYAGPPQDEETDEYGR